jgi:hypothetical protein
MKHWMMIFCMTFLCHSLGAEEVLSDEQTLAAAYEAYHSGETATDLNQRRAGFNRALALYTSLEDRYQDGHLDYNIGNSYYQLGEYPWAILYYSRAEQFLPREKKILDNLLAAQEKAGIHSSLKRSVFENVFYFHYNLSEREKLASVFMLTLLIVVALSIGIWTKNSVFGRIGVVTGFAVLFFLVSLMISHYFTGVDAVLIKATPLYRDSGTQYATVVDQPLYGGLRVNVLEVSKDGRWLKVVTSDGTMGYVPFEAIRLI